jgi:glycosyltransferase 2 family protein
MRKSGKIFHALIFAGLSAASIGLILAFTANRDTLAAVAGIRLSALAGLAAAWLFILSADAAALWLFVRGAGGRVRLGSAFRCVAVRTFFNAVTPFSAGGQPMLVYALSREGVSSGRSSTAAGAKIITFAAVNQLGAATAFLFFHDTLSGIPAVNAAFLTAGILFLAGMGVLLFLLLRPDVLIPFAASLARFLHRVKLIGEVRELHDKIIREARRARASFRAYFGPAFGFFAAGSLANGLVYAGQVLLLWATLRTLGVGVRLTEGLTLSALLLFLLTLMPTPGNAGLGEAVFVFIFAGSVPAHLLGVAVVLWRLFSRYLTAALGALSSAGYLSRPPPRGPR